MISTPVCVSRKLTYPIGNRRLARNLNPIVESMDLYLNWSFAIPSMVYFYWNLYKTSSNCSFVRQPFPLREESEKGRDK